MCQKPFVVAVQVAEESWNLPLHVVAAFPVDGGGEVLRQDPSC